MLRDFTGLVTHKNSDVAGHSAAAVVDERRATSSTIELSRCETVESHTSTQVPFTSLCRACIVGRSREAPQPFRLSGEEAVTVTMLVVSLDVLPLTLTDNSTGEGNTLTAVHTTYDPGFWLQFSRNV